MYPDFSNPIFSWAGLFAATLLVFLSIYILSDIKKKETLRKALFLLTIVASAQTFYLVFHSQLKENFENMLLGIPTLIGPIVFFYIQNYVLHNNKASWTDYLGILPFFLVAGLPLIDGFRYGDYPLLSLLIVVAHWALFLVFCGIWIYTNRKEIRLLKPFEAKWLLTFYGLNTFIWLMHSLLYILGEPFQIVFASSIALLSFSLIFFYFKFRGHQLLIRNKDQRQTHSKSTLPENAHIYLNKIETLLFEHKLYLDPNLTIPKLADKIQIQPYLLSQIINSHYSQSFPDFINTYRINEAKTLLTDNNHKISSIAADCGFNTLSSFNLAFKKSTRMTPSEFRNKAING